MTITTTLDDVNERARVLSEARGHLGHLMQALNAGIEALKADAMGDIRAAIDIATDAWGELEDVIEANPQLFVRPRTVAAHGIVFGIQKGKGSIDIPDPERTVVLIKRQLPEYADKLIATKEVPVKKAIERLTAGELKRIGVSVVDAEDQVVIRSAPSDVDKLVKALIRAQLEDDAASRAG